jgi:hypothetical protein
MNAFEQLTLRKVTNDFEKLKRSVSEWVIALDTKQFELEKKIQVLEHEVRYLKTYNRKW